VFLKFDDPVLIRNQSPLDPASVTQYQGVRAQRGREKHRDNGDPQESGLEQWVHEFLPSLTKDARRANPVQKSAGREP
jgi:hypothetical protein